MIFGVHSGTLLFFRLLGKEEWFDSKHWYDVAVYLLIIAGIILISSLLKGFLKKRIDMDIFNNRIMHLLLITSVIALVLIYINSTIDESHQHLGVWSVNLADMAYMLFFVSGMTMFAITIRYVSKEIALRTEMLISEASKKYIQNLEKSYTALRTIKHDYVNVMTSFKLYIDNGDMAGREPRHGAAYSTQLYK